MMRLAAIITSGCAALSLVMAEVISATPRSPLGDRDILATHRVSNRHQCLRLCWYLQQCARFSFYTRNDNPGGRGDNCVLHEKQDLVLTGPLMEGWLEGQASGDSLEAQHPCKSRSCSSGEICLPVSGSHVCHPVVPTLVDKDDCYSNPCGNNGTCLDLLQTFRCVCLPGFSGLQCQQDIDECLPTPCQNSATCVDRVNSYTCTCPPGYTGDHCQYDIDECQSNPCPQNAACSNQVNSYSCTCLSGYSGDNCQYACSDPPLISRLFVRHSAINGNETAVYSCLVTTDVPVKGNTTLTCLNHQWIGSPVSLLCAPFDCWYKHSVWGPVYRGTVRQTKSGKGCMSWKEVQQCNIWETNFHSDNNTIVSAMNYCRSFSEGNSVPWCYNGSCQSWEECSVSVCNPFLGQRN